MNETEEQFVRRYEKLVYKWALARSTNGLPRYAGTDGWAKYVSTNLDPVPKCIQEQINGK